MHSVNNVSQFPAVLPVSCGEEFAKSRLDNSPELGIIRVHGPHDEFPLKQCYHIL